MSPARLKELMKTKIKEEATDGDEEKEEEVAEEPILTNTQNRFMIEYADQHEWVLAAEHVTADIASGKRPERVLKTATTGRIQFEGIMIEEKVAPLLLCENCEVRYSVIYCRDCGRGGELQCLRCCELCHPIPQGENRHPHELETSQRLAAIRPIDENDVSRVAVESAFPIPDYYIEESDAAIAKGVDLSIPNTLATNYVDPAANLMPNKVPFREPPKYLVDDKLIFMDPVTGQQAYGRVISEWDQRHGAVAPSILRGEGSMYLYFVEKIDLIANIGTLADLLKFLQKKARPPEYPILKDLEDVPYRWEFAAAREVNRKVNEMHELQALGPRRHFRAMHEEKPNYHDEDDEEGEGGGEEGVGEEESHAQRSQVTFENLNIDDALDDTSVGSSSIMSPLANPAALDQPTPPKPEVIAEDSILAFRHVELTKDEQLDRLREQLPGAIQATSPRDASKRSFFHAVQIENPALKTLAVAEPVSPTRNSANYMGKSNVKRRIDEPMKIIDGIKASNVLVLRESELLRPEDVFNMDELHNAKQNVNKKELYLTRCFNIVNRKYKAIAFYLWHHQLEFLAERKRNFQSVKIQKYARRWLHRNTLSALADEWQEICYQKWSALHSQFHYCTRETPYSVTMDHKIYFLTKLDAGRYSVFMRLICMKILKFVERKRSKVMSFFLNLWRDNTSGFNESDIKYGHFDMTAMDIEDGLLDDTGEVGDYGQGQTGGNTRLSHPNPTDTNSVSRSQQQAAQELYTAYRKHGHRAVSGSDDSYVNVSTIPLSITRKAVVPPAELSAEEQKAQQSKQNLKGYFDLEEEKEEFDMEGVLPPYRPDLGIKLPAAIPVYMPANAKERLEATQSRRLTYCSYKAHMEGPCDDACWIIPGRIAMGCIPWGRANKRTHTSSITSLLLGGCDVFVSCMEEGEESECEQRLEIQPVAKMLKKAAAGARMAVDEVVRNSKRICDDMERKLKNIPVLESTHKDYAEMKKEMTRCKARVKLSREARSRSQGELERLPKVFEWIRVPLKTNQCPTIHEILPVLWQLERKLSEGHSLYLYSREGHGRCGLLAGCLLGRLYSFNPSETLIRLQNSHDCAKREEGRPVPISCPQLNSHRNLISQVIMQANRPMMGVVYRFHDDPETKHDILNMPKRGTGLGLSYTEMPKNLQATQTAPFATVTSREMDVAQMARKKETVSFETDLARDIKPSYSTEHGRGADTVDIPEIYEMHTNPKKLGQNINIVRETALQRQPENGVDKKQTFMPVLRVKKTAL